MSFARLGELELVSFDPRHGARSPPIGKRILVGRYNDCFYPMVQ